MKKYLMLSILLITTIAFAQNEATAKRLEMISLRNASSATDTLMFESLEIARLNNNTAGEIIVYHNNNTINKITYLYPKDSMIGKVNYYFHKGGLIKANHQIFKQAMLKDSAYLELNYEHKTYFNGKTSVYEISDTKNIIARKEVEIIKHLPTANEISKLALKKIAFLNKK